METGVKMMVQMISLAEAMVRVKVEPSEVELETIKMEMETKRRKIKRKKAMTCRTRVKDCMKLSAKVTFFTKWRAKFNWIQLSCTTMSSG